MTALTSLVVTVPAVVAVAAPAVAQSPVGALAIDERQGDQWGWAVDYETAAAAQGMALQECGSDCSVVLTFDRCAAYAADQDANSTAVGWAESYDSATGARQAALAQCLSRGGPGCMVRVWGCNGPVVEEDLRLNRATRRQIQFGLRSAGFDPGGADGLFGPRTRAAIRNWQSARGARSSGYLDGPQVEALRSRGVGQPLAPAGAVATDAGGVEVVFWQSVQNSTNPADFQAYLGRFPNGVFSELAQNRLGALRRTGAVFRPAPTCARQPAGAACWQEVSLQPGCYVWNPARQPGSTATWTGECTGGFTQGTGTLTWAWDGNWQTTTGRMVDGKANGHAVFRFADGGVQEGPVVDGEPNGRWLLRFPDGGVEEGPLVDGERHGHWVHRSSSFIHEGPYVDGKRDGLWVTRMEGRTEEVSTLYRNGERVR